MKNTPIPVRPARPATDASAIERAAFANFAAASGRMGTGDAVAILARLYPDDRRAAAVLNRAAVDPGTTGGWGASVLQNVVTDFFGSLNAESAVASLMGAGLMVPLDLGGGISIPHRPAGPVTAPWVGEGDPIPVRQGAFAAAAMEPAKKLATITTFTGELSRRTAAEAIFRRVLREDAGLALDSAYFSAEAGTADGLAGLLYGVTPVSPSGSTLKEDLADLAGAVSANGSGQVAFVMSPKRAARAAILEPDYRSVILASRAISDTRIIGLDPASLAHGFDGQPDITASREAVIHMSNDPDPISDGGVSDPVRSAFQTDALFLRLIVDASFCKVRSDAVAYIEGASW